MKPWISTKGFCFFYLLLPKTLWLETAISFWGIRNLGRAQLAGLSLSHMASAGVNRAGGFLSKLTSSLTCLGFYRNCWRSSQLGSSPSPCSVRASPLCHSSGVVKLLTQQHRPPQSRSKNYRQLKCNGLSWSIVSSMYSVGQSSHMLACGSEWGNWSHVPMGRLTKNVKSLLICYSFLNQDKKLRNIKLCSCSCGYLQSDFPHGIPFISQISVNNFINPYIKIQWNLDAYLN